ncbi:formylglycine-generating enzyme family protein [Nitrospina watsonii]|uniref:formylglycine-generating enzyme family protein n=1 Tax=Nitrospina watsonii TaxID=1323948 RepID=UPI00248F9106|nr:formylglycine-generating enzyme family protein [Nitrospina watsonii]
MCLLGVPSPSQASTDDVEALIRKADDSFNKNEFPIAEKLYTRALELDPDNPRVMHSLAQVKTHFKKYDEALKLVNDVLAMPVAGGRNVIVFRKGSSEGEKAELVDEIVLPPQRTNSNMRNYVDIEGNEPIPHYRLYFKEKDRMELVPQSVVKLKYDGVLRAEYHEVEQLKAKVQKAMIAQQGVSGNEEMVAIQGGCFQMGSEQGTPAEQPVHEVCVDSFKMDTHEVTQARFQAVMESNPSAYNGPELPVDSVTWNEASQYCQKVGKRLPTEAEWEYAARGGTKSHFYWGNTVKGNEANFCDQACQLNIRVVSIDDGFSTTSPVGKFKPNPYGLHDMAGNVAEWVADWMDENYYRLSPKDNPQGPSPQDNKGVRGGAWNTTAGFLRSSNRAGFLPDFRNPGVGFRCVASSK